MKSLRTIAPLALLSLALGGCGTVERYEQFNMTFFVTSTGSGKGADYGGLAGADGHCQALATAVGSGHRTWRAYLSASPSHASPTHNARDRIGRGPWQNAKGVVIARNLEELHGINNINNMTALTEKGDPVRTSSNLPSVHDILTGTQPNGMALAGDPNKTTCGNWTRSGEGAAMVGHYDRRGIGDDESARSWNSSHPSRGCSQDNLRSSGGAGLLYCFATN
jgi:hypothetical protein